MTTPESSLRHRFSLPLPDFLAWLQGQGLALQGKVQSLDYTSSTLAGSLEPSLFSISCKWVQHLLKCYFPQ